MTVPVVAAIIRRGNRILIAQRKKDSKLEANRWEFPGGKLEFGEHPEDALRREIMEELNVRIRIRKLHSVLSHVYDFEGKKLHVLLLVFLADYESGVLKNLDVQNSKWVLRSELIKYEFVSGDRPLIKSLTGKTRL